MTDPTVAKALAHPLRTRLLAALEDRTASPSELANELDVPLGVLSYHIRRLTTLGFLKLVRRVPRRGAVEHYYTATFRPRISDEAWGATPASVKQSTLGTAIGQLGAQVSAAASGGGFDAADSRLTRSPLVVDDQGWRELAQELEALNRRVQEIEAGSRERMGAAGDGQRDANVVLMLFESPEARVTQSQDGSSPGEPQPASDAEGGQSGTRVSQGTGSGGTGSVR